MKRLIEYTVFSGVVTDWRLATVPTSRSPLLVKATTDGVVRPPSWFGMTTAWPPSMTETTELVVPKSMPMILLILPSIPRPQVRDRFSLRPLLNFSVMLSSRVDGVYLTQRFEAP